MYWVALLALSFEYYSCGVPCGGHSWMTTLATHKLKNSCCLLKAAMKLSGERKRHKTPAVFTFPWGRKAKQNKEVGRSGPIPPLSPLGVAVSASGVWWSGENPEPQRHLSSKQLVVFNFQWSAQRKR